MISAEQDSSGPGGLRVVQLCAPAGVGGLERVVQELSAGLAGRGHRVTLAVVTHPDADRPPVLDAVQSAGVDTKWIRVAGRALRAERSQVRSLLERADAQVLHTHGYRSDLLHGGLARGCGVAAVSTLHGSSRMGGFSHLFEWMQERALADFDAVVAVSRPLAGALEKAGVPRAKVHTVPNAWSPGVPPASAQEARVVLGAPLDGTPVLGWVGRLIPIKGCDVFVEALARIQQHPWRAIIVGDGPERSRLAARVRSAGLEERVRFTGTVPDASRYMSGFDVFVLSSRSEGTPMVLLEAMNAACAVVATAVGGVPDVIGSEDAGCIVPPEEPDRLSEAMALLLANPGRRGELGVNGRVRARREFAIPQWIRRHEAVYASARARRARARDGW